MKADHSRKNTEIILAVLVLIIIVYISQNIYGELRGAIYHGFSMRENLIHATVEPALGFTAAYFLWYRIHKHTFRSVVLGLMSVLPWYLLFLSRFPYIGFLVIPLEPLVSVVLIWIIFREKFSKIAIISFSARAVMLIYYIGMHLLTGVTL